MFTILVSDLGSHVVVDVDPIPGDESAVVFKAIFITFPELVKGLLKGCRPIIGMNGCHLKFTTGGCLQSVWLEMLITKCSLLVMQLSKLRTPSHGSLTY